MIYSIALLNRLISDQSKKSATSQWSFICNVLHVIFHRDGHPNVTNLRFVIRCGRLIQYTILEQVAAADNPRHTYHPVLPHFYTIHLLRQLLVR